jgi:hypothetical protein
MPRIPPPRPIFPVCFSAGPLCVELGVAPAMKALMPSVIVVSPPPLPPARLAPLTPV